MREAVFDPQRIFSLGLSLHQEGRLAEAQAMYGQVLDVLPEAATDVALYWHAWAQQSPRLDRLTRSMKAAALQVLC